MNKQSLLKLNNLSNDKNVTINQIKTLKKDLKYIETPELRAVAKNMIANKEVKVKRLQNEYKVITNELGE